MANNMIQVKRTSVSGRQPNTTGSYATNSQYIASGEFALNLADGILFSSNGSAVIEIGANNTNVHVTNSLILDNDKQLRFKTVNSASYAYFVQQSDDNFVFYTTNGSYSPRPIWSIFANSGTSALGIGAPVNFSGANVNLGTTSLFSNGSSGSAGQVLTSNGSATYWSSPSFSSSVNTAAQYTWSNTHTFNANVSFGNAIALNNGNTIYFNGLSDANWKMGRDTGSTTKWIYTNNTIDIIIANSANEGFVIGQVSSNTYFETGYLGTYVVNKVVVGNSSSNSTINSTSFTGTSNNATYAYGKTEGNLNVNSALYANLAYYVNANNGVVSNSSGVFVKAGQTTVVNSTGVYVNTASAFTWTNDHTFNANITANNVSISGNISTVDSIYFANAGITATEGVLTWNPNESTLDLGLTGNNSILQIGQEVLYRVKNQTGSTINNGTVVMANGTLGASGRILVSPAVANGTYPSQYIMGVATENITNGSDGYVAHFGKVRGLNTSGWSNGAILYADPANTGGLTATKPTAPNNKTIVAIVISSHATNGELFIRPTYGSNLSDDELAEFSNLANGELIVYNSTNKRFQNYNQTTLNVNSAVYANGSYTNTFTVGTASYFVANGNLGVGTNSPAYKLDINGNFRSNGARPLSYNSGLGSLVMVGDTGGWAMGMYAQGSSGTDRGGFGFSGAADALGYYWIGSAYNNATAYFKPDGSVGIGTSTPAYNFEVFKTGGYWNGSSFTSNPASVGITNSLSGGYDSALLLRQTDTGGTSKLAGGIGVVGASNWTAGSNTAQVSDMYFLVRNNAGDVSERMRINYLGRVGIGTSSPSAKLTVDSGAIGIGTGIYSIGDITAARSANTGAYYFGTSDSNRYLYHDGTNYLFGNYGFVYAPTSFRAPIFYDSDNTAYYVDPASTTNLNGLTVAGTITGSISGSANNASYLGGTAAASYQLNSTLSANVATMTANNTSYVGSVSAANVVSNAQLSANLANYQTTAGLSANVATLTANNANYVKANNGITSNSSGVFVTQGTGTVVNATGVHVNSTYIGTLSSNNADYLDGQHGAYYAANSLLANYALLSGATFSGDVTVNANLVITGTTVTLNTATLDVKDKNITVAKGSTAAASDGAGLTVDGSNIGWYYTYSSNTWTSNVGITPSSNNTFNIGSSTLRWATVYANNVTVTNLSGNGSSVTSVNAIALGGKTEGNLNVNSATNATTANNSTYAFGKSESALNVNSAISANNSDYLDGQHGAYYTNATNITTGTLPYAQLGTNVVNTTANFTVAGNLYFTGTNTYFNSMTTHNGGIYRLTGNGPAYWLQQDGTGRSHWYWNTAGGSSPTFTLGGEDASALSISVTGSGAGGALFHRSASGVGQANGAAITWTTTLYTDLNSISWKGTSIAVANGSTYNLNANNSSYLGGVAAASYQLNSTLSANIASYLPTYTGVVNASSHTVGTTFVANTTAAYHTGAFYAYYNLDGQVSVSGDGNGSLEIGKSGRTGAGSPFIDFHSSASSPDYDVRMIVTGGNSTSGSANLTIFSSAISTSTNTFTIGTSAYHVANGNFGISNSAPADKLSIEGSSASISATDATTKITITNRGTTTASRYPQLNINHYSGNSSSGDTGGFPVVELFHYRGNIGSPLAIQSGDLLGGFNTWGSNSSGILSATRINGIAEANFTTTATAGMQFLVTNNGTQAETVRMAANGNVGINTTSPSQKLHVSGTAYVTSDVRSPIFYDSDNTGYYVNPTGTTSLNTLTTVGNITTSGSINNPKLSLRNDALENYADASDSAVVAINYYGYNAGTTYFRDFAVFNGKNTERFRVLGSSNYTTATGSLRAPLFYDSDNTSYYLDPASTTTLNVLNATTKSFLIDHPSKPGMKLRYGSLESPYHGVRLTGEGSVINGICTIKLPDYIKDLCQEAGAQVQITNIKHGKVIWVEDININSSEFTVMTESTDKEYRFYWSFTGVRKDVEDLVVEF